MGVVTQFPRVLMRKIVVEPTPDGWRSRIVGFDPRFYSGAVSPVYPTREQAEEAAAYAARRCGLPVVTVETLTQPGDPGRAA